MLSIKHILLFFWIEFKKIIHKIIMIINYHFNSIFNYFIKTLFNFFFTKKIHNIKSLFAFDVDPRDLRKHPNGAYGWLNYIFPNINKYSKYKFKRSASNLSFKVGSVS